MLRIIRLIMHAPMMKIMLIFIRLHTKINTASTNTYTTPTTKNTNFHHRQGQKFKTYTHASTLSNTSTRMETQTSTYSNHIHTKLYCNGSAQNISPSVFKCENKLWCCSRVFPNTCCFQLSLSTHRLETTRAVKEAKVGLELNLS